MFPLQLKVKSKLEYMTESTHTAITCAAAAEIDVELSDSDTEQETLMSHITEDHNMPTDWESNNGQCRQAARVYL